MWQQRAAHGGQHMLPASGNGGGGGGGGWGQQQQQQDMSSASAAAQAAAAGYHRARGQEGERAGDGSWEARSWPGERGDDDEDEEEEVAWSASEQACLRKSVKENGLDDWTLGDWSEVRSFSQPRRSS